MRTSILTAFLVSAVVPALHAQRHGATATDYYKLTRNVQGDVGRPPYYFNFVRTVDARRKYCDVNLAFEEELHLGRHGIGHGEASQ